MPLVYLRSLALTMLVAAACSSPAATAQAPTQPTEALSPEQAALSAATRGDRQTMERLKGSAVTLQGRIQRTLRTTKAYRDIIVLTGPDFKLGGAQSGYELIVRIPASFRPEKLPPLIDASGTLTDFEPRRKGEGLQWMPVVTISFLK